MRKRIKTETDGPFSQKIVWLCAAVIIVLGLISPETVTTVNAHGWKAPSSEAKIENPVKLSPEALKKGEALYREFCAYCHGPGAQGGSSEELDLSMAPPDLIKRLKGHSQGDFFWKINRGRGDMPGFEKDLEAHDIWQIIHYIQDLIP